MWFNQLSFFILPRDFAIGLDDVTAKLAQAQFTPCQGLDWVSTGFYRAAPFSDDLVFAAQNTWRLNLRQEDKVLPAAVIKDILDEKVAEIQATDGRNIGRKEKQELKEQITDDLLPRAFTKSRYTEAVLNLTDHLLFVNQSNATQAENLVSQLRQALGSLPARLPHTVHSPSTLMTEWLTTGEAAGLFELDCDCELKGVGEAAAVIKISKQDLSAPEVRQHLECGKICTQLGLVWNGQIAFVLNEDFSLKRIQYLDMLQEEATEQGDDLASLFAASQIIMSQSLSLLVLELIDCLGGLRQD